MSKNKKGQLTMIGLVIIFATVIVFAAIYPALSDVITTFLNTSTDTTLNIIVQLIPLLMFLGIVITLFMYVTPYRPG